MAGRGYSDETGGMGRRLLISNVLSARCAELGDRATPVDACIDELGDRATPGDVCIDELGDRATPGDACIDELGDRAIRWEIVLHLLYAGLNHAWYCAIHCCGPCRTHAVPGHVGHARLRRSARGLASLGTSRGIRRGWAACSMGASIYMHGKVRRVRCA